LQIATSSAGLPSTERFRRWTRASLLENADVTLRLVDRAEGRALNRAYRRRDYATNVLTFPYPDLQPLTGDIVLCLAVIKEEARRQGKAELMEGIETEIVSRLGYPDPYA